MTIKQPTLDLTSPGKRTEAPIVEPLPVSEEIVRTNLVLIPKLALPASTLNRLLRITAFQHEEFYEVQSMRLSTYDTIPQIMPHTWAIGSRNDDLAISELIVRMN